MEGLCSIKRILILEVERRCAQYNLVDTPVCEIPVHKYFVSTPVRARARFSLVWQLAKPPSYCSSGQSR